jgi:stage V sporulation protein G
MKITEVRIHLRGEEKLKAFATLVLDDSFAVRNVKVIEGKNGLFVSMPSRKRKDGTYQDVAHPLNNETREMIEKEVISRYEEELKKAGEEVKPEPVKPEPIKPEPVTPEPVTPEPVKPEPLEGEIEKNEDAEEKKE